MAGNTVLDTLSKASEELIEEIKHHDKTILDRQQRVDSVLSTLETAQENQSCATYEYDEVAKSNTELRDHYNSLPQDQRPTTLLGIQQGLNAKLSGLFAKCREMDKIVLQCEMELNKAKTKLAVAKEERKRTQIRLKEISDHIGLVAHA